MTLSARAVRNIKERHGKMLQRELATMYGVSDFTIGRIQRGQRPETRRHHSHGARRRIEGVEEKSAVCACGARLEFDTVDGILKEWCPRC